MLVGQVILQKWDSRACRVPWVQILASSQTKRSDGLSQKRTRQKVGRKYLKKRTSTEQYRMEGTMEHSDRLTRVSRGIRQWEGAWLGQWGRLIGKVRLDTATGMPCRYHVRLKHRCTYFLATLLKYPDLLEPLENIISLGLITWMTKRNQLDTDIQSSYLPGRRLYLANPRREQSKWQRTSLSISNIFNATATSRVS